MKKNDYIYTGSTLYKIAKVNKKFIKVVPAHKKMSLSLTSRTYHQALLEDLGYMIGGKVL